jgi:hypothetical protein
MAGLHPQEKLIEELVNEFRVKWSGSWTEFRMAEELIALNMVISQYEDRIAELEADRHRAFYREKPKGG